MSRGPPCASQRVPQRTEERSEERNGGPRRVTRSRTPADAALHVAHLRASRHRALRQRRFASAERLQSLVERADLVLVEVARQLEQVAVELAQRHLALAIAHD